MKKTIAVITVLTAMLTVTAQERLSLDYCRQQAVKANKELLISNEKKTQAEAMRQMAFDQFMPKLTANGAAIWSSRSVQLLSDQQQNNLSNMGTNLTNGVLDRIGNGTISNYIANYLANTNLVHHISGRIDGVGQSLVDDLSTDTRAIYAGMVSVTQPIFMGGKLISLYKIASANAEVKDLEYEKAVEDLEIQVDEYYWRVVSVENKYRLAKDYCKLLDTLYRNVGEMVDAGVATRGDLLKVQVKLNEAQMSVTKAENGLALAKMALAQLCGMPINSDFTVEDADLDNLPVLADTAIDMEQVYQNRTEMQMLQQAQIIGKEGVNVARSTFMPNIVANGGYLISNPNLLNGFEKEFGGMFYGGVMVNFPLAHPTSFHSMKLAKSKQREVEYQTEQAKELIKLQVTQISQQRLVAMKNYLQAESSIQSAEENMRLAQAAFDEGVLGASDLMGAQTAWMKAFSEKIDAAIELKINDLYLNRALGEKQTTTTEE
jgi:outer membrane protein TolC